MPLTRSGPANMNPALSTPPKMMGITPMSNPLAGMLGNQMQSSPQQQMQRQQMPPSPRDPMMDGRMNPQQQMAMQQSPTYNHPPLQQAPMSMPNAGPQGANVNPGSSYEPPPPPGYEYFDMYDGQQHLGRGLRPIQGSAGIDISRMVGAANQNPMTMGQRGPVTGPQWNQQAPPSDPMMGRAAFPNAQGSSYVANPNGRGAYTGQQALGNQAMGGQIPGRGVAYPTEARYSGQQANGQDAQRFQQMMEFIQRLQQMRR